MTAILTPQQLYYGNPAQSGHSPRKADIAAYLAYLQSLVTAANFGNAVWYETKAAMDADLDHDAGAPAFVYGDSTPSNNGQYIKLLASGLGSWDQIAAFLPGYQQVFGTVVGGTANALEVDTVPTASYVDGVQQIRFIATAPSGAGMTVSFDGGDSLVIKTAAGSPITDGQVVAGMPLVGSVSESGTVFRLESDISSAATLALTIAAKDEAVAAAASIGNSIAGTETVKTASYTIVADDGRDTIVFNSASAVTATLTAAATVGAGFQVRISNVGDGMVTVDPDGSETINSSSTLTVKTGEVATIWTDGTAWRSVTGAASPAVLRRPYVDAGDPIYGLVEGEDGQNHIGIKAALVDAAGVKPLIIPPGDFTLTGGVTNNFANTHIKAYGATIRANFANILFRSLDPYSRFTVEGGTYDGLDTATRGIYIASDHAHVFNTEVKGFNDTGILIAGATGFVSDNPRVHDNYVHDNDGIGIGISRASRAVVSANIVRTSGLHAMTMDNVGGAYNICANNVMDGACTVAGSGAFATDFSQHLIVIGNQIANSASWGLSTPNHEGHTDGMIVVGNTFVHNASGGVRLLRQDSPTGTGAPGPVYCSNCYIADNTFVPSVAADPSIEIYDMGTSLGANKIGKNNYRNAALPTYPKETLGTPVSFFATFASDASNVTGDSTDYTVIPATATLNEGSGYNTGTGVFTAPRKGQYEFQLSVELDGLSTADHTQIQLKATTTADGNWRSISNIPSVGTQGGATIKTPALRLDKSDTVSFQVRVIGTNKTVDILSAGGYSFVSGRLVHEW